ncbi:MAG: chromate transporter [Burkholderiales bacterium]
MNDDARDAPPPPVTFGAAFRFWLKLGFISFGGPAGQIAIMHSELVERRRWISEKRFLHALNYCMVLPGPEAHSWPRISAGSCIGPGGGRRRAVRQAVAVPAHRAVMGLRGLRPRLVVAGSTSIKPAVIAVVAQAASGASAPAR